MAVTTACTTGRGKAKAVRRMCGEGELHYAGPNPPKVRGGLVAVEALVNGSFACSGYAAAFYYRVSGGRFVPAGRPARRRFKCGG